MSVQIPKVSVVFGSVEPPQGDVLELRVHLGCTKEVSSFECLLQNFDKKYTVTNAINVGDSASISIGRGTGPGNCPLILTGRVEEVEPESTPVENYIRVRGRCLGEKIFRRVVTKTYKNQKGEAIVKDLLDNYAGLGHVRDSTELVENTDTTYTLLEYENTPVFDVLKYITESADKAGVIGFDFRVEYDGKFAFFPCNSKTSPISLSEVIEHSRYSKDIHRVRNKIKVYGAAEKPYPLDTDGQPWSDSFTEDLTKLDNYLQHDDGKWEPVTGNTNLYIETVEVHTGSKSVKLECTAYMYYMGIMFTFNSDKYINCNLYPKLCFTLREDSNHNKKVTISLEDKDGNTCRQTLDLADYDEWQTYELGVGKQNQESWTMSVFNSGPFDWENLKIVRLDFHQLTSKHGIALVDRMHFGGARWEATEEDSGSQSSYGLRELVEVDEELHSDHECSLRGKALLNHLGQPADFLTLRTTCLDYGTDRLLPGDKIHVTLPNENIDSDFRIIAVEHRVSARDQTLEITLELGKEKPLLADYLYGLRSTTVTVEKLMRTKAGLTGGVIGGGGGGGGGGMVDHGNEWHTPDFSASPHGLVDHNSGSARISVGLDADKPAVGTADRLYFATDTKILYRDTGSAWEEILRGEGATRLAQLSEKAHSSLTGIGTDDHHAKLHQAEHLSGGSDPFEHRHKPFMTQAFFKDVTEVSTSSVGYALLEDIGAISPPNKLGILLITFCHNAKNEGTIAARGADYQIRVHSANAGTEYTVGTFRWTDGLADYKMMAVICHVPLITVMSGTDDAISIRIYWKVDNGSYPAWSKERTIIGQCTERTGAECFGP